MSFTRKSRSIFRHSSLVSQRTPLSELQCVQVRQDCRPINRKAREAINLDPFVMQRVARVLLVFANRRFLTH